MIVNEIIFLLKIPFSGNTADRVKPLYLAKYSFKHWQKANLIFWIYQHHFFPTVCFSVNHWIFYLFYAFWLKNNDQKSWVDSCLVIQNAVHISLSLALFKVNFINWNHPLSKIGRHPDLDKAKLCIPLTELSNLILNVPAVIVLIPHQQLCMNVLWEETAGWSVSFWQILSMVQCQPGETQQMAFHRGYFVGLLTF